MTILQGKNFYRISSVVDTNYSIIPFDQNGNLLTNIWIQTDTTTAPLTINLPELNTLAGQYNIRINVVDISGTSTTNSVSITATGSDIIDATGTTTVVLNKNEASLFIIGVADTQWSSLESFTATSTSIIVPGSGLGSTLRTGFNNTASGCYSTAIGQCNTASGTYSVALGSCNRATADVTTALGYNNLACGFGSAILGGQSHVATNAGVIVGGSGSTSTDRSFIGYSSFSNATAEGAVVTGGAFNNATGQVSFIGTGFFNTASGAYSAILGGGNNFATCRCSFIVGSDITTNRVCATFVNNLSIMNIPTSSAGLPSGSVYRNGISLEIVP